MRNLILVERDDLEKLFKQWISEVHAPQDDELLTTDALANYLGYSLEWVRQKSSKVNRGHIVDFPPFIKRGRKILFRKSDVDTWLTQNQTHTKT